MKVKICGITSLYDAALCEEAGADAVGFVHYPGRRRSLSLDEISRMATSLGPMTTKVIVCAPETSQEAVDFSERSDVDVLQTYSLDPESLDKVRESGLKVIRAVSTGRAEAEAFASQDGDKDLRPTFFGGWVYGPDYSLPDADGDEAGDRRRVNRSAGYAFRIGEYLNATGRDSLPAGV